MDGDAQSRFPAMVSTGHYSESLLPFSHFQCQSYSDSPIQACAIGINWENVTPECDQSRRQSSKLPQRQVRLQILQQPTISE